MKDDILKPYIIAETAYNHEGDIKYLFKMIDDIADINLNAIKFHLLIKPESYIQKKHPLIKEIKKWVFSKRQWEKIIDYSNRKICNVIILCDDVEGIDYIVKNEKNIDAIELHATGLNDYFLLDAVSEYSQKIILGIGGSSLEEIAYAVNFLKNRGRENILLMYGFQSYPTDYAEINLAKMLKIRELFNLPIGYADHTSYDDPNNEIVSCFPAAMGINILEKHYTPDAGIKRIDYHAAVGKKTMTKIKELVELALKVNGDGSLKMSKAEMAYGNTGPMKKAIVAKKDIKRGEKLSLNNLWFKRTVKESSIKQNQFPYLIGLKAIHDLKEDEIVDFTCVEYEFKKDRVENFTHLKRDGS